MINLPDRSSVWVSGLRLPGAAGSGICLTQTTTFMADHLCGPGPSHAIPPAHRRVFAAQTRAGAPLASPPTTVGHEPAAPRRRRFVVVPPFWGPPRPAAGTVPAVGP